MPKVCIKIIIFQLSTGSCPSRDCCASSQALTPLGWPSENQSPEPPLLPIQKKSFQGVDFRLELINILGLQDPVG